jgi:hypothetical protein
MFNCSVYQLKNYSLRSCHELAICIVMVAKGDGSENILHNEKNTAAVGKYYIFSVCVCSLSYPACSAHVPHCICSLASYVIFINII